MSECPNEHPRLPLRTWARYKLELGSVALSSPASHRRTQKRDVKLGSEMKVAAFIAGL